MADPYLTPEHEALLRRAGGARSDPRPLELQRMQERARQGAAQAKADFAAIPPAARREENWSALSAFYQSKLAAWEAKYDERPQTPTTDWTRVVKPGGVIEHMPPQHPSGGYYWVGGGGPVAIDSMLSDSFWQQLALTVLTTTLTTGRSSPSGYGTIEEQAREHNKRISALNGIGVPQLFNILDKWNIYRMPVSLKPVPVDASESAALDLEVMRQKAAQPPLTPATLEDLAQRSAPAPPTSATPPSLLQSTTR